MDAPVFEPQDSPGDDEEMPEEPAGNLKEPFKMSSLIPWAVGIGLIIALFFLVDREIFAILAVIILGLLIGDNRRRFGRRGRGRRRRRNVIRIGRPRRRNNPAKARRAKKQARRPQRNRPQKSRPQRNKPQRKGRAKRN